MVIRLVNILLFFSDVRGENSVLLFSLFDHMVKGFVLCCPFLCGTCSILKVFEMAVLVSVCQGFRKVVPFERGALEAGRVDDARRWGGMSERVVHFGVLFWDTLLGHVLGCLCGAFAWGKRFCDERKMVDVDAFYGVKSLFHCCFAALCFVLFCPMLLWF
ncbi:MULTISPECIES: hypothetical protein [unclassified Bartonella]|uniref:hypothetical protein n=1 Tax=unclassified Bartonella TaxID=2645622 RepID=UPI0035D1175D